MGKVIVVGIGPGSYEDMTIRADRALQSCDAIVGYGVYVDLVKERYPDKAFYETPMTQEAKRCALALEFARAGKTAAMVCSGDSGIYGMAALVYELRGESREPEIEVIPGLTAACSAAALLGAPLTHDFAVISLSDRLTPWETIEKRLTHAAKADLTIALPGSVTALADPRTLVTVLNKEELDASGSIEKTTAALAGEYSAKQAGPEAALAAGCADFAADGKTVRATLVAALDMLSTKRARRLPKKHGNMSL